MRKTPSSSRSILFSGVIICLISLLLSMHVCVAVSENIFTPAQDCGFCHTSMFGALQDGDGNSLSIYDDWASTMMGNSFRDPLFRAKLESELLRNAHLSSVIEDKCLTCHTPMARTQALHDGIKRYPLNGTRDDGSAHEGVSCTLCHQIAPTGLGTAESLSGNYTINSQRKIFGPYKDVFVRPMLNHVGYLPLFGAHMQDASLCGTCHTLLTPYVDNDGNIAGQFPEQTPYLEWLNSSYAGQGTPQSCQDCHMPRVNEPIKITNRPPWLDSTQTPFWKHHFTGGNTLLLKIMLENQTQPQRTATDTQLRATLKRTEHRLTQGTADISVRDIEKKKNLLILKIEVANRTGHKFPTGFPARRAWLKIQVHDKANNSIFLSGDYAETGEIHGLDQGFEPHYDVITSEDQVQIFQAVPGDVDGNVTYTLLRAAAYLKDNRLMPSGYLHTGPFTEYTQAAGRVLQDTNFNRDSEINEGTGSDVVTYEIFLPRAEYPLKVVYELLYQTISPRFADDLGKDSTPAVSRFMKMYAAVEHDPVVIDSKTLIVE